MKFSFNLGELSNRDLFAEEAYIGGDWVYSDFMGRFSVFDPSTDEVIARVASMSAAQVGSAVEAAHRAFKEWRLTSAETRARLLESWYALVMDNRDDLAYLMTCEQGKPLAEAKAEVEYAASYIKWFAEEARRTYGTLIPSPWPDRTLTASLEPVGVCAAITPWNFPLAMVTRKVAPAIAAGCSVVLKPASQTPLSALALAKLFSQLDAPAGLFNVVPGDPRAVGDTLLAHPLVRKVSFTGSTEVGRMIAQKASSSVKRLSLELGGNAPFIVFEDADLDLAVSGYIAAKFRNSGQTCVCANRLFVQAKAYEPFKARLVAAVKALRVGDGRIPGTDIGPLIDSNAVIRLKATVDAAVAAGAELVLGGSRHSLGGSFFAPTILSGVDSKMSVAKCELFGPVSTVISFETEEEVLAASNDTDYGLAAYVFTKDAKRMHHVTEGLEFGMIGVNTGLISTAVAPFGGVKQSGYGREGSFCGIDEYLSVKYKCVAY